MIGVPIEYFIGISFALFSIGLVGVVASRNLLLMILSVEVALVAATLLATLFFYTTANGDIMTLLFAIWTVAAVEAIALIAFYRYLGRFETTLDVSGLSKLGE